MAEIRMLPKHTPRSTGIERVTTSGLPRPNNAVGGNSTSNVSASPGASARAHAHVVSARNPSGVNRPQPQRAQQIQTTRGSGGATAAKVELLPNMIGRRPGPSMASAAGASGQRTVQVIAAPHHSPSFDAGPEFTAEQMLLVASLLEGYAERTKAISDVEGEVTARDALLVLREMHAARSGRASRAAHHATSSPSPQVAPTQVALEDEAYLDGAYPEDRGPDPIVVQAETSTIVMPSTSTGTVGPGTSPRAA